jgi:outer membrane protein assembly factor BamA
MKFLGILALILIAGLTVTAQTGADQYEPCSQDAVEKQNMITEAEAAEFNVRRIEIAGNTFTRHRTFSRKMAFNEGDIFKSENLLKSIEGVNRIDLIEPITIDDVEIRLDRLNRDIDFVFCVVQRKKK